MTTDFDRFLRDTPFAGYQRITLPSGHVIPGTDRSPTADLVFADGVRGKTVLDVGCNYGFFLHDAIRRGASRAVGVEADLERARIASTLATQWNGSVEIREGLLEEVELDERFDVVLFLNVLHHVTDPVAVMRKLASVCRGTLIVEFRQPHDPQFVRECLRERDDGRPRSLPARAARRARSVVGARLMELVTRRVPMIGVGGVEYHRSYFFTREGFRHTFAVHNRLVRAIEFRPSLTRGQVLAFCDCRAAA